MADSLSFKEAEKLIRENPKQADALAFESQEYFKTHPDALPTDVPKSVLDGKAISEAYSYLRERHEGFQMSEDGAIDQTEIPSELGGLPVLAAAFLQRPKIMEDDGNYQKIEEGLKKDWLKNHNEKDFMSKEGLDYLYGSSLHQQAEEKFRNDPKYRKLVEKYDKERQKIYKEKDDDPTWLAYENRTQMEIYDRNELLGKKSKKSSQLKLSDKELDEYNNEIAANIAKKNRDLFDQDYPEKATAYSKEDEDEEEKEQNLPDQASDTEDVSNEQGELEGPEPEVEGIEPEGEIGEVGETEGLTSGTEATTGLEGAATGTEGAAAGAEGAAATGAGGTAAAGAGSAAATGAGGTAAAGGIAAGGWIVIVVVIVIVIIVFIIVLIKGKSTPPCDTNGHCDACIGAPGNTCSINNGTCNYIYDQSSLGDVCTPISSPNTNCTYDNCSLGYLCASGSCVIELPTLSPTPTLGP